MTLNDLGMIFHFIGGLGMFLYGMHIMADGLQRSAGGKLKDLMGFLTKNRFIAVVVGAAITAIIQSSSATTVMVVGFVNAGMLTLTQAVGVIMGANIGTTITAWIVSMSDLGSIFKPEFFSPVLVGIGAFFMLFCKQETKKKIGEILVGFGVLFIGLTYMSDAIKPYREAQIFVDAFRVLGRNPVLAILVGAGVTAVIQSSSASVGILQTLALNGVVNWQSAVFITLGQNIGTCVTALISSAGTGKNAKRASIIHLLFNTLGAVIFGIIMFILFQVNRIWAASHISAVEISIFHTIFNILNTMLLFPFANKLVKLSEILIREDKTEEEEKENIPAEVQRRLDRRILNNPSFAIETAIRETSFMGELALEAAKLSVEAVQAGDQRLALRVYERENDINQLEKILTAFLVEVDNLSLTEKQHLIIKNLLYTVSDIERVGDHSENIAQLADARRKNRISFSKRGIVDLEDISIESLNALESSVTARKEGNTRAIAEVEEMERRVDDMENEMRERHIQRLSRGNCNPESGVIFLDILTNLERISDHACNIAGYVATEG